MLVRPVDLGRVRRIAVAVARDVGFDVVEAESEAMLAIIDADRWFDPERGVPWEKWWPMVVRWRIKRSARPRRMTWPGGSLPVTVLPVEVTPEGRWWDGAEPGFEDALVERLDGVAALSRLVEGERAVTVMVGSGWSGREVAAMLGVTESRVSQIRSQARRRLGVA